MTRLRLLPFGSASGPWNLAADDALLESAASGMPSLRFYTWSEPTLSLGYFQQAAPARALDRLGELAWLRRPSGGAALVHHREITYALALPAGSSWLLAASSLLLFVHQVIQSALAELGVSAQLCQEERKLGEVLCFLHHTPGDLLLVGQKIVGSAQRKCRGAVLQHGGILLERSPYTPQLPGIAELSGQPIDAESLQQTFLAALARLAKWTIEPATWTERERAFLDTQVQSRYTSVIWNEKR